MESFDRGAERSRYRGEGYRLEVVRQNWYPDTGRKKWKRRGSLLSKNPLLRYCHANNETRQPPRWIIRLTSGLTDTKSLSQLLSSLSIGLTCQVRPIIPLARLVVVVAAAVAAHPPSFDATTNIVGYYATSRFPPLCPTFESIFHGEKAEGEKAERERERKLRSSALERNHRPGLAEFLDFPRHRRDALAKAARKAQRDRKPPLVLQPLSSLNQLERSNHSSCGEHRRASSRPRIFLPVVCENLSITILKNAMIYPCYLLHKYIHIIIYTYFHVRSIIMGSRRLKYSRNSPRWRMMERRSN